MAEQTARAVILKAIRLLVREGNNLMQAEPHGKAITKLCSAMGYLTKDGQLD